MPKDIKLRLEDINYEILNKIKNKTNIPITRIINMVIKTLESDNEFINSKNISDMTETILKVKITKSEKDFLQEQAIKNGSSSLTSEVKYRLLNTIYREKYFTNIELSTFIRTKGEVNKVGINLNQLLKLLNKKSSLNVNEEILKNMISDINIKVSNLSNELENIIEKSRDRY